MLASDFASALLLSLQSTGSRGGTQPPSGPGNLPPPPHGYVNNAPVGVRESQAPQPGILPPKMQSSSSQPFYVNTAEPNRGGRPPQLPPPRAAAHGGCHAPPVRAARGADKRVSGINDETINPLGGWIIPLNFARRTQRNAKVVTRGNRC